MGIFLEPYGSIESRWAELGRQGPLMDELIQFLNQKISVILSTSLLDNLRLLYKIKENLYANIINNLSQETEWQLYVDQTHSFYLFLNSDDSDAELEFLGFGKLLKVNAANFFSEYSYQYNFQNIELDCLCNFFNCNSKISKRIYLSGHGLLDSNNQTLSFIAGLPAMSYYKLLSFFKLINCEFLFVASCYANGLHSDVIKNQLYPFTLVVSCLPDAPCYVISDINAVMFYLKIDNYLKSFNIAELEEGIKLVTGNDIYNIAFIKRPFESTIKTYCEMPGIAIIDENKNGIINICDKLAIMLQSIRISHLAIQGDVFPKIFSLLPGDLCHEIDVLDISHFSYNQFLEKIQNTKQLGNKKIFIKKMLTNNGIFLNVNHSFNC